MPSFAKAYDKFAKDGTFELNAQSLYAQQIRQLQSRVRFLQQDKPEISAYQLHLNRVKLILGRLPKADPERVISGVIVEHPEPRSWQDRFADLSLLQMARSSNDSSTELRFSDSDEYLQFPTEDKPKEAFLDLLSLADTWSSIKIDWVFSCEEGRMHYLRPDFQNQLLSKLAATQSGLKELSLKPCSLGEILAEFINFLLHSPALESLHLEINSANRGDDWLQLSQALAGHPKLKCIDFGSIPLDTAAYQILPKLLDKNYRIERIDLPEPGRDNTAVEIYEQLKQRLSKPVWARFKEEQLSQPRLLQVAIKSLEKIKALKLVSPQNKRQKQHQKQQISFLMKRFVFLLSDRTELELVDDTKEAWLREASVLPRVYQDYKAYMKRYSDLVQLHLQEFIAEQGKTVGHLLLEKAVELGNAEALTILLDAKMDLLAAPQLAETPILVTALQGKGNRAIKEVVLHHVARDPRLMQQAAQNFSEYPEVCTVLGEIKTHLDGYADILIYKSDLPKLISITKNFVNLCRWMLGSEIPSEKRGEEYAKIYLNLDKCIQVAMDSALGKPSYDSLSESQKIVQEMRDISLQAERGLLNRSALHSKMLELLARLDQELKNSQSKIVQRKDNTIVEQENTIVTQQHVIAEKEATINKLLEAAAQEQAIMQAKHAQEQAEMKVEIEAKMKAEIEAKMQAEIEAKIKAEMKAFKQFILAQNRCMNPPSESLESLEETPGSSAHFLARR
ncbi:MAG: hypothetical protein RLZZ225_1193 [Pseudomonadota bacterium]|jgi:hypothetical protein